MHIKSKEEDVAALDRRIGGLCPRRDPVSEIRSQLFHQIRIAAPENIDIGLPDLLLQKSAVGVLIQKNGLQSCDGGCEDRLDAVKGTVAQNAQTGHSKSAHLFGARKYRRRKIGAALLYRRSAFFINKKRPFRIIMREESESLRETIKFRGKCFSLHRSSIAFFNKECAKMHQMLMNI